MSTSNIVATGGTVKRIGLSSHLTHTFTESGDFTVHRPVIVRYLIVGGVEVPLQTRRVRWIRRVASVTSWRERRRTNSSPGPIR
jgi:hypothetical protein